MSATAPTKTDIFGVCTAVGRDLGFHADILRVAFAIGLFVNPWIAIAVYAVLGLAVAASRWFYPETHRIAATTAPVAVTIIPAAAPARNEALPALLEAA